MQSSQFKISGLLQLTFLGSKTTQPLETYSRSEQTKPFGDHQDLPPTRGVGYLNRFQGCLLPYTYTGTIQEIPEIKMCQQLGWLVNLEKSELEPKQDFDFVGYQFDLRSGRVQLTPDRWQNLQEKMLKLLSLLACPVREFMSLIGLLTATEK